MRCWIPGARRKAGSAPWFGISGLNYRKKGLQRILEMILRREAAGADAQGPGGSGWFSACANCKASRSSTLANNRASRKSLRKTYSR